MNPIWSCSRPARRSTSRWPLETSSALSRAGQLLWLVTGADKRAALGRLLAGDETIPAGRVQAGASLVMADQPAK